MPTSIPRTLLSDFALANPTYAGAQIAAYQVDANLAITGTLAPLYADQAGSTLLANPQLLDSSGRNLAPIYIDRPVIVRVTRGTEVLNLGVQGVSGRWRGVWAAGTLYYLGERVRDPAGPSTYLALVTHTAGGSFATDLAAPRWEQEIDAASMGAATVEAVFPAAPGRNGKLLGFNASTGDPEAVDAKSVFVGSAPTGGTATAQTLALTETLSGLTNGLLVAGEIGITCGAAPQLNVASTGLKKIYVSTVRGPVQAVAGELAAGNWALFAYDATQDSGNGGWVLQAGERPLPEAGETLGLLLNPHQEVSQANGTASVTVTSSLTTTIDRIGAVENCGTMTATAQQVADPFSSTAGFRRLRFGHRTTIGTAQATLSGGEFLTPWRQRLPGTFWRGLAWGTADAQAVDVVAVVSASVAGTYAVALRNGAAARSYVSTVTLAAGQPTLIMFRVPGDTTGTWPVDGTTSLILDIGAISGSTLQAPSLNAWNSGSFISHSTCTNWGATSSATFTVGYADVFAAGVLPFASATQVTGEALQALLNLRRAFEVERARCRAAGMSEIYPCGTATGTANAITLATRQSLTAYDVPHIFQFTVAATNTGNVTLNVDGVGAQTLRRADGSEIGRGILVAGAFVQAVNVSATEFRLVEPVEAITDLDIATPSGTPTYLEFALPAGFASFIFDCANLTPTAPGQFAFQLSLDGGASWLTGGSDYSTGATYNLTPGFTVNAPTSAALLSVTVSSGHACRTRVEISPTIPGVTGSYYTSTGSSVESSGNTYALFTYGGAGVQATTRPNRIRFFFNGTTFKNNGRILMTGVRA